MMTKGEKIILVLLTLFVVVMFSVGAFFFSKILSNYQKEIDKTSLMRTYSQDIVYQVKQQAQSAKHQTIQDIAYAQLQAATGLNGNTNSYSVWGVHTNNKFIKYGVLVGDGIPYISENKSQQTSSLSDFDINDKKYWQNVKDKNFDAVKSKINNALPKISSKSEQEQQIKSAIIKAKKDDILNQQQREQKAAKAETAADQ